MAESAGDAASFARGVADGAREGSPGALLNRLFGVRTAGLFGEIAAADLPEYLSGLLIGAEIGDAGRRDSRPVHIIASDALAERYRNAAAELGITAEIVPSDCIGDGWMAIARLAGLVACARRMSGRHGPLRSAGGDAAGRHPARYQAGRGGRYRRGPVRSGACASSRCRSTRPTRSAPSHMLAQQFGERALIGGGTVMTPDAARRVIGAGGRLVVMPHSDAEVIRAAKEEGGRCVPGVATPTEGFAALAAGADALKLFPGEALPPAVLKAWKAVFPPAVPMLPVGGVTPETMADYVAAGAAGFGIGSALYKPGFGADEVGRRGAAFVQAWRAIKSGARTST